MCVQCRRDAECAAGQYCAGGVCEVSCSPTIPCPAGRTCCGGACVDTLTNRGHCGACGAACALANAAPACRDGRCAVGTCMDPYGDCDGLVSNGCETDLRDVNNCGACDRARPGCPEPDLDHDGLPNSTDRCPERPETFNNYEDGDGCPDRPPLVTLGEGEIRLLGTINFATASDRIIGARSYDVCDSLVAIVAAHAEIPRVEVQGHTDDRGSDAFNLELSQRRASAVRQYLVDHGIEPGRVVARGYGLTRPRVPNSDADHRAQNRRVEIHLLEPAPR